MQQHLSLPNLQFLRSRLADALGDDRPSGAGGGLSDGLYYPDDLADRHMPSKREREVCLYSDPLTALLRHNLHRAQKLRLSQCTNVIFFASLMAGQQP